MGVNVSVFEKFPAGHHRLKPFSGNEIVGFAVFLALPRRPGRVRHREVEADSEGIELLADAVDERRLPGTGGT